jgi:hypothetical protein
MDDTERMRRERNARLDKLRKRRITLQQLQGIPTGLIDATPIRNNLNRLHQLGWSYEALSAIHGQGTPAALRLIAAGVSKKAERKFEAVADIPYTLAVPASVADTMWVPTLGATRRVRALLRQGWRHQDLHEYAGRSVAVFATGTYTRTKAIDWRIVAGLYDQLSMSDGGSQKTATRAQRLGYAPPLAWDNIDNPDEQPTGVRDPDRTLDRTAERADILTEIDGRGGNHYEAARTIGIRLDALEKWMDRHDMRPMFNRMRERAHLEDKFRSRGAA